MPLFFQLIFLLAILGFCLWILQRFVPIASPFKELLYAVISLGCIWWILEKSGLLHSGLFR